MHVHHTSQQPPPRECGCWPCRRTPALRRRHCSPSTAPTGTRHRSSRQSCHSTPTGCSTCPPGSCSSARPPGRRRRGVPLARQPGTSRAASLLTLPLVLQWLIIGLCWACDRRLFSAEWGGGSTWGALYRELERSTLKFVSDWCDVRLASGAYHLRLLKLQVRALFLSISYTLPYIT